MTAPKTRQHGGARPGAGRKPSAEPLVLIQIRVPKSVADQMGDNRTKFAREAVAEKIMRRKP